MNREDTHLSALLSLLKDDDVRVASLAMEQFLKLGNVAEEAIAELQEDGDKRLRHRIHQMSGILNRRQARMEFISAVESDSMSLWEGVCRINSLYDPHCEVDGINREVTKLTAKLPRRSVCATHVASLMRNEEFSVPDEDLLDSELYMMDSVLETRYGSPLALCTLAMRIGQGASWQPIAVLYEGRLCLVEPGNVLLDPADGWKVQQLKPSDKLHPCAKKDVWYMFLSQLFLIALVDGQLRQLYHFGDLITALNHVSVDVLPFPLGDGTTSPTPKPEATGDELPL